MRSDGQQDASQAAADGDEKREKRKESNRTSNVPKGRVVWIQGMIFF